MPAWLAPAITAAGMGISAAIAKGKDNRQIRQQGRLNEQQIEANTKMLQIQNEMGLDMWKKTGPVGMMDELKKGGLNAGLMYGMGGAGGQSLGSGSANVGAAKAPSGSGRETEEVTGMAMQLALLDAQKKNIEADTELKRQEAGFVPTKSENVKATTGKVISETSGQELKNKFDSESMTDRLSQVNNDAVIASQRRQQEINNTDVSDATKKDRIKEIQAHSAGELLRNALTIVQSKKGNSDIKVNEKQIEKLAADITQRWAEIDIKTFEAEFNAAFPNIGNSAGNLIQNIFEDINDIVGDEAFRRVPRKIRFKNR